MYDSKDTVNESLKYLNSHHNGNQATLAEDQEFVKLIQSLKANTYHVVWPLHSCQKSFCLNYYKNTVSTMYF